MVVSETITDCVDLFRNACEYDGQAQGDGDGQLATEITRLLYKLGNPSFSGHAKIKIQ